MILDVSPPLDQNPDYLTQQLIPYAPYFTKYVFWIVLFLLSGFTRQETGDVLDTSYDYIVVGGGLAGCVVASRLSEDPNTSVLLLEAGGEGNIMSRTPSAWFTMPGTHVDWGYVSTPQLHAAQALVNQQVHLTAGKVVGGGSMLNVVMWVRGIRSDFDAWQASGADGWGYEDNLPYFIKSEDVQVDEYRGSPIRGVGGPITVNEGSLHTNIGQSMIAAGAYFGYRTNYDYNENHRLGFARVQSDVSQGLRADSEIAYLTPILSSRPNLRILTHAQVTKVIIDADLTAIGVEYYTNLTDPYTPHRVYANREVLLAAGAIGTVKLLMLSGIGPRQHLQQLNIPVMQDLPVGDNFMDHVGTNGLIWEINQTLLETMLRGIVVPNVKSSSSPDAGVAALVDWTGFINTKSGPGDPTDTPDIQFIALAGLSLLSDLGLHMKNLFNIRDDIWEETFAQHYAKAFTSVQVSVVLLHPSSRGVVRLRSINPFDQPWVNPNYLSEEEDVTTLVRGMRFLVSMFESPPMRHLNPRFINISLPGCPFPADPHNDGYLECIARSFTQTIYHYSGTCKMGRREDAASVVDPELRVIGIQGLRVVETSVFPTMTAGNTQATAYMVAERAADIVKGKQLLEPIPTPVV